MSKNRNRNRFDVATGRPSRGYKIFVVTMALFLVVGSVALIVGTAFDGGSGQDDPVEPDRSGEEIERLQTVVADDPQDTESMGVLANILANNGQVDESLAWYERAVAGDPENGDLRLAFGLALFQLGNDFDAELQLERAMELMPDIATPPFYLGQLQERRANPDIEAARAFYEQALDIAPDSLVGEQAQARLDDLNASDATATP